MWDFKWTYISLIICIRLRNYHNTPIILIILIILITLIILIIFMIYKQFPRGKPPEGSSVGRAMDCSSIGHWFDSGSSEKLFYSCYVE